MISTLFLIVGCLCQFNHAFQPAALTRAPALSTKKIHLVQRLSSPDSLESGTDRDTSASETTFQPVLDFSVAETVDKIDRLDDAIMGGISTSTVIMNPVKDSTEEAYAKWFGVCRTDGGGFTGFRTNPFVTPLQVGNDVDGFYLICRLASDQDANRRIWKMSTRTTNDRGEQLYQAPFSFEQNVEGEWQTVKIPFSSFRLVRGPRQIPNSPPLNVTQGLYQIGMTMSKFIPSETTVTELDNFRPGFFELNIKEIGFYKQKRDGAIAFQEPTVLSKDEAKKRRPVLLKILLPISKLFFSEQSQRRKSAMKILREKRNLSRGKAILFGLKSRSRSIGMARSLAKTCSILAVDSARTVAGLTLRLAIFYPISFLRRTIRFLRRCLSGGSGESGSLAT